MWPDQVSNPGPLALAARSISFNDTSTMTSCFERLVENTAKIEKKAIKKLKILAGI